MISQYDHPAGPPSPRPTHLDLVPQSSAAHAEWRWRGGIASEDEIVQPCPPSLTTVGHRPLAHGTCLPRSPRYLLLGTRIYQPATSEAASHSERFKHRHALSPVTARCSVGLASRTPKRAVLVSGPLAGRDRCYFPIYKAFLLGTPPRTFGIMNAVRRILPPAVPRTEYQAPKRGTGASYNKGRCCLPTYSGCRNWSCREVACSDAH